MNTLKEIKERFEAWTIQEEQRKRDWKDDLSKVLQAEGPQQVILDFVGAVSNDDELSQKMLDAVISVLPQEVVADGVSYLTRAFKVQTEQKEAPLSSNEQLNTLLAKQDPYELIANAVDATSLELGLSGKSFTAMFYALPEETFSKEVAHNLLYAILGELEDQEMADLVDDLFQTYQRENVAEGLSKKEKRKRRLRKRFGKAPEDDESIPDEMRALANGVVANRKEEDLEENECAGNPFRNSRGRYSSSDAYGSYTLPKKPKRCATSSGKGRRAAGSRKLDKSEFPCGRGSKKKCKDGSDR
jgi:hypothetical protein